MYKKYVTKHYCIAKSIEVILGMCFLYYSTKLIPSQLYRLCRFHCSWNKCHTGYEFTNF